MTQNNMEKNSRKKREESGCRSSAEAMAAAADKDGWRRSVADLCTTRHEADRYQVGYNKYC